jgi:hypothetical protein
MGRLTNSFRVLQAMYPEFKEHDLSIGLSYGMKDFPIDTRASFYISIQPPLQFPNPSAEGRSTKPSGEENLGANNPLLTLPLLVEFGFHAVNAPEYMRCLPQYVVSNTKNFYDYEEPLRKLLQQHGEWSDERALVEARKAGIRYATGDEQALLKILPLKELGDIYGPLRVSRMQFTLWQTRDEWSKDEGIPIMSWMIEAKELGTTRLLNICVEPFFGRIIAFSEVDTAIQRKKR